MTRVCGRREKRITYPSVRFSRCVQQAGFAGKSRRYALSVTLRNSHLRISLSFLAATAPCIPPAGLRRREDNNFLKLRKGNDPS